MDERSTDHDGLELIRASIIGATLINDADPSDPDIVSQMRQLEQERLYLWTTSSHAERINLVYRWTAEIQVASESAETEWADIEDEDLEADQVAILNQIEKGFEASDRIFTTRSRRVLRRVLGRPYAVSRRRGTSRRSRPNRNRRTASSRGSPGRSGRSSDDDVGEPAPAPLARGAR